MITRREALGLLGTMSVGTWLARSQREREFLRPTALTSNALTRFAQTDGTPPLAPGAPMSAERMALINAFKEKSAGVEQQFEARTHRSDWDMPYRLFRPDVAVSASTKLPLVLFLHGSGGLGTDNQKQMGLGNIFGTRVWAMPEHQKTFPCYVVAPQTDRGWVKYGAPAPGDSVARPVPGLGDGARAALEIVDVLRKEFPIDERRIYVTGQSMGGAGVWHLIAQRPTLFAAAAVCCGSVSTETGAESASTPLWNFHGGADTTVPIAVSRDRIAARRKAGGHPLFTEYAGVNHNSWEWAYTEPALTTWVFAQRRAG